LVLEAARWAASSSNLQPWRFLVGVQGTETYSKIFSTLVGFNQSWAGNAHVLILGIALVKDKPDAKPNAYALYDLGQAVSQLTAQAAALGLHTHSMGGFDHAAARQAFGLTDDYAVGAVTALGYQAEPTALSNDQLLEREVAPRSRKPLSEIALSALGVPFQL
jgi:nitroreductase